MVRPTSLFDLALDYASARVAIATADQAGSAVSTRRRLLQALGKWFR